MCGLVGIVELKSERSSLARVAVAMNSLVRRGPDGDGTTTEEIGDWIATLGHRRLKIIDLDDRAAQPFRRDEVIVLFNGELYNYVELRRELWLLGAKFVTESDTEVIAAAYQSWDTECFSRFDGMFALVIIDSAKRRVLVARDPFGEKPLYIATRPNCVAFGSTADSVLAVLDAQRPELNLDWVDAFLHLGFSPAPMTVWKGIEKLRAGEVREFDLQSRRWSSREESAQALLGSGKSGQPFDIIEFEAQLLASIERRLRADVPLAILLSGGIDSAYVATLIRRRLNRPLVAVTIRDQLNSTEELQRAASVCERLAIQHRIVQFPTRPLAQLVEDSIAAMDEPIADPAFPVLMELFAHVPREFRVVLTGDGADELFLSYANYRRLLEPRDGGAATLATLLTGIVVRLAARLGRVTGFRAARWTVMRANLPIGTRFGLLTMLPTYNGHERAHWAGAIAPTETGVSALWRYSLAHELPEYLLVKADRASMHYSFESRTPYLSRKLFRYLLSCDPETIGLGEKKKVTERLNYLLGTDLLFRKRGFFASGQELLERHNNWHPLLHEPRFRNAVGVATNRSRTDATTYYRLHVLNSWLKTKCA